MTNNARRATTTRTTQASGGGAAVTRTRAGRHRRQCARTGSGDVYAGRDGNVYRNQGGSWQKYENGNWGSVDRPTPTGERAGQAGTAGTAARDRARDGRDISLQRLHDGPAQSRLARPARKARSAPGITELQQRRAAVAARTAPAAVAVDRAAAAAPRGRAAPLGERPRN